MCSIPGLDMPFSSLKAESGAQFDRKFQCVQVWLALVSGSLNNAPESNPLFLSMVTIYHSFEQSALQNINDT